MSYRIVRIGIPNAIAILAWCASSVAVTAAELHTLSSNSPTSNTDAAFGYAVAADNGWVAVGVPGEDDNTGEVYVFSCDVHACSLDSELKILTLPQGAQFGHAVAISGNRIAVSAPGAGIGEVFVFERSGTQWLPQTVPGLAFGSGGRFGAAIALSGNTLVVGGDDQEGRRGVVYVWQWDGSQWSLEQILRPLDRSVGDHFGAAVAVSGNTLLVAAPYAAAGLVAPDYAGGEVHVFERSGGVWSRTQILRATTPSRAARFGFALALDGNSAVVGEPGALDERGRVYHFERSGSTFALQGQWAPIDIQAGDAFGWSLALRGDRLLVAAPFAGNNQQACGRVVSYRRSGGGPFQDLGPLRSPLAGAEALFGWGLALGPVGEIVSSPATIGRDGFVHYFDATESLFDDAFEVVLGPCFGP